MLKEIDNCSTIIVGKKASKTGQVLLAHNEDDIDVSVQCHLVPRQKHDKKETISFPDGTAIIPQVKETFAYNWSEYRGVEGVSFADSYFNEYGVAVVSNGCVSTKNPGEGKYPAGIGYALRKLIAERAKTAREGVEIAAELIEKYGYISSRSYEIADKNEAWVFQVGKGNVYAARRVQDDEILYIPNWYTIHEIDFTDTKHKNYYWSSTLIDYAVENGWYKPKKKDYSDFDFAKVYQGEGADIPSNTLRSDLGWSSLTGKKVDYKTFSLKAEKKYSVDDIKTILRKHYVGYEEDLKDDPTMSPHRFGICRETTVESFIFEFNKNDILSCMWRASPRPDCVPFIPWYVNMTRLPKGYEWMGPNASLASHFSVDESELKYHDDQAYSVFLNFENLLEFDYPAFEETVLKDVQTMEAEIVATKKILEKTVLSLAGKDKKLIPTILTDYTCLYAEKALDWAKAKTGEITTAEWDRRKTYWRSRM